MGESHTGPGPAAVDSCGHDAETGRSQLLTDDLRLTRFSCADAAGVMRSRRWAPAVSRWVNKGGTAQSAADAINPMAARRSCLWRSDSRQLSRRSVKKALSYSDAAEEASFIKPQRVRRKILRKGSEVRQHWLQLLRYRSAVDNLAPQVIPALNRFK